MKKITSNLLSLFVMMTIGVSFSACEKEQPNQLSGFYLTEAWDWDGVHKHCKALNFINKNTVKVYNTVINYPHWDDEWGNYSSSLGIGYWYFSEGSDVRATYSIVENKVYIPNEGMILTIEGDKLYPDGSVYPYIKYSEGSSSKSVSMKGKTLKFVKDIERAGSRTVDARTFKFTDDVSCTCSQTYELFEMLLPKDDPDYYNVWYNTYTSTYECFDDVIKLSDQNTFTKVNGKWQWKDHEDYKLQ